MALQAQSRTDRSLKVAVSALTFRRPDMLVQMLAAIGRLQRPESCELLLVIVDNDPAAWLAAFDQLRNAEFASGDFVYLDGWPFSKSEVALLRLAPSLN